MLIPDLIIWRACFAPSKLFRSAYSGKHLTNQFLFVEIIIIMNIVRGGIFSELNIF